MSWGNLSERIKRMSESMVDEVKVRASGEMLESLTSPASYVRGIDGITPVDSGNLMANTIVSSDVPDFSVNKYKDVSGDITYKEGMYTVMSSDVWSIIYIQNNTPYNINAEFKGWGITPAYRYFSTSVNNTFNLVRRLK